MENKKHKELLWTPQGYKRTHWTLTETKNRHGTPKWKLAYTDPTTKERIRRWFGSEHAAKAELERVLNSEYGCDKYSSKRESFLTQMEIGQVEVAFSTLDGVIPREKVGLSVVEASRDYLAKYKANLALSEKKVSEALAEFLKEKKASGCEDTYLKPFGDRVKAALTNMLNRPVSTVMPSELQEALASRKGLYDRRTLRTNLGTFFGWCETKAFISENPAKKTTPVKIDASMPEIIPLDRVKRMLEYAKNERKEALGWLVLGLFAGLRPGEIDEIIWDDVKLGEKLLIVRRGKLRTRRPVELPEAAVKWLELCKHAPLAASRRAQDAVKVAGGYIGRAEEEIDAAHDKQKLIPWPADALRHTAISHYLNFAEHEGKTALWAGNSPDVIFKHYRGLISKAESTEFWAMRP